jgi:hypothetical protein
MPGTASHAAEILDAPNEFGGQYGAKVEFLRLEERGPTCVVKNELRVSLDHPDDLLFEGLVLHRDSKALLLGAACSLSRSA